MAAERFAAAKVQRAKMMPIEFGGVGNTGNENAQRVTG